MFAAGEEETIFLADTATIRLSHVSFLFFLSVFLSTLSLFPHPSRFLSPRPRHPRVVSPLLTLLVTEEEDPWWHRGRAP